MNLTYEDKIKYLRRYRNAICEINRLEDEIAKWRSLAEKVTASLALAPGGGTGDRISSAVEHIEECIAKRERELSALCVLRDEIGKAIKTVADERLARLLRLRYIDNLRIEEIAEQEHIDSRWVQKLLRRGVEKMAV